MKISPSKADFQDAEKRSFSCMNIPILSYLLRKLGENLGATKKALKTGKEMEGETKQGSLLGIFRVVSGKSFQTLKPTKSKAFVGTKK